MASAIYSVEVAKETLFKQGFLDWKDLAVGDGITEMEKRGFEFFSRNMAWTFANNTSSARTSYLSWNPSSATRPAFSHTA
ncbi:hypothetical protein MKZ38_001608 [Zalerion maritima]|uniref:Uncharacterized protein n=1 Tax=Zalerion maritima TaxID=339359 RepID=A0AAD5RQR2_9PEZI|nr:hypothetical protein MKZ38_001608 [Zalerion maritima]